MEQAEEDIAALKGTVTLFEEIFNTLGVTIGGLYMLPPTGDATGIGDSTNFNSQFSANQVPYLLPGATYFLDAPLTPGPQDRILGSGPTTVLTYGTSWSGTALFNPTAGSNLRIEKMSIQTLGMAFIDWANANTQDLKLEDLLVTCGTSGMVAGTGQDMMMNCNAHQLSITDCTFTQNDPLNHVFTINDGGSGTGTGFSGAKMTRVKTFLGCVPTTTVAAGSNGGEISQIASWGAGFGGSGILDVASTVGYPTSGTIYVAATGPTIGRVTYTGVTSTSFTGCAYVSGSATGTIATGGTVSATSGNIAQAGYRSCPGWDITTSGNKNVDVIIFRDCFFSNNGVSNNSVSSFNANQYGIVCGITTAAANNDFDRFEMYSCDFDAPIGGMVQILSVECVWLHGLSCGNIVKGANTATADLISIGTFGGVGTGQPSTFVSVRDYCRESGGVPHGSSNPSDFGCTSDTLGVLLSNMGVPDNGVTVQINLNTNGGANPAANVLIEQCHGANVLAVNNVAGSKTIQIYDGAITVGGTAITVP